MVVLWVQKEEKKSGNEKKIPPQYASYSVSSLLSEVISSLLGIFPGRSPDTLTRLTWGLTSLILASCLLISERKQLYEVESVAIVLPLCFMIYPLAFLSYICMKICKKRLQISMNIYKNKKKEKRLETVSFQQTAAYHKTFKFPFHPPITNPSPLSPPPSLLHINCKKHRKFLRCICRYMFSCVSQEVGRSFLDIVIGQGHDRWHVSKGNRDR